MKANKAKVSTRANPQVPAFKLSYQTPDGDETRRLERPTIEQIMSAIRRCGVDVATHFSGQAFNNKKYHVMTITHPFRERHLSCQYATAHELMALLRGELEFLQSLSEQQQSTHQESARQQAGQQQNSKQ